MNAKNTSENIWKASPCTIPFVTRNTPIDRTPRFNLFSIYHKDDVHKPKKIFNQFEKPQLLLKNFQRQIQEATNKYKVIKRESQPPVSQRQSPSKYQNPQSVMATTLRLYQIPQKFDFKHDAYGNRSNLAGQYDAKQIAKSQLQKKKNFSCGRRVDLSKPLNFYPGPGTYFAEKINDGSTSCRNQTCISFKIKRNNMVAPLSQKQKKKSQTSRQNNKESQSKQIQLLNEL